jgi:hypothetical protein
MQNAKCNCKLISSINWESAMFNKSAMCHQQFAMQAP